MSSSFVIKVPPKMHHSENKRIRFQLLEWNSFALLVTRPALQPLPAYPYVYTDHPIAKVAKNYHVQYDSHWYSVPHRLVGEKVEVIASHVLIKVHHNR